MFSIDQPQSEEMPMSDSATTTDHKVIKKWAEERDGRPATVRATEEDGHAGILRIDFGPTEDRLDEIEWDEFFRKNVDANVPTAKYRPDPNLLDPC